MSTLPLVTIVVISYNQSKYIKENLDSIKAQTYLNIELIVADDASPDNSVEIFESWLKNNNYSAKKNFHQKNTGLATVLNECIELAKGKYIKLIAADDFLHPEAIENCVLKLEELGDEYGMVFTDTYAIDDNSKVIADIANYNDLGNVDPLIFKHELIKGNRIAALTVLMKLDVVKKTGKYDSNFIVEDYYRWLKISRDYLIAYVPKKLAYYRQHTNNISKTKADRIDQEDLMLKIMFDDTGYVDKNINSRLYLRYINNQTIDPDLKNLYSNYPYKTKRLALAITYHIPVFIYRLVSKVL